MKDDEGNIHDEGGYEDDPWSGLAFSVRHYNEGVPCPVKTDPDETYFRMYDSRKDAVEEWNTRSGA